MNKDEIAGLVERLMSKVFGNLTPGAIDHADLDGMAFLVEDAADALTTLFARVETLEAALQFYARESSWKSCGVYMSGQSQPCSAVIDEGDRARKALGGDNG